MGGFGRYAKNAISTHNHNLFSDNFVFIVWTFTKTYVGYAE